MEGFNGRLLIGATDLALEEIVSRVRAAGGVAIASHIDRESFSVIGQLGFIPGEIRFDALEISRKTGITAGRIRFPEYSDYAFIETSDAHFIRDIGTACTSITMAEPTIAELKMAFEGKEGRRVCG
ncbi:MAG: hypothetical protein A4E73_02118 [Syntrophaceae bacterium PtaU1.Bin231]|nr:MAG: hypothetical protein A4E73_02118 [Syntrophaceae bacterium PtaU1.Bin231]